jgi:hypothetical protein
MTGIRALTRARWSGRLLAVGAAYLLVTQALFASVGAGMLAAPLIGQPAFEICGGAAPGQLNAPAHKNDRGPSDHREQCPFCFIAAQSAVHVATVRRQMI